MTAPLTPNDPRPPFPPGPDDGSGAPTVARDVREAVLAAVLVALCGLALGGLWLWLAPRVPLISDGSAIYLKDPEGEQSIGADGWFTLLGLGMGVLSGAAVYLWRRTGGVALMVGLAAGGVLASVIAWRLGVALGPTSDVVARAKHLGPGKVFQNPLALHAKGALLAWPAASMAAYLVLTTLFTPYEQPPAAEPAAQWPGWEPRGAQPARPLPGAAPGADDPQAAPPGGPGPAREDAHGTPADADAGTPPGTDAGADAGRDTGAGGADTGRDARRAEPEGGRPGPAAGDPDRTAREDGPEADRPGDRPDGGAEAG